jgi:hypothetical protein
VTLNNKKFAKAALVPGEKKFKKSNYAKLT